MGQKDGEKWTVAVTSQPTLPKSDRLPGCAKELDECVGAFLNRQIEGDWPCLWIGASYVDKGQ